MASAAYKGSLFETGDLEGHPEAYTATAKIFDDAVSNTNFRNSREVLKCSNWDTTCNMSKDNVSG
jgi:hypothetical protein